MYVENQLLHHQTGLKVAFSSFGFLFKKIKMSIKKIIHVDLILDAIFWALGKIVWCFFIEQLQEIRKLNFFTDYLQLI